MKKLFVLLFIIIISDLTLAQEELFRKVKTEFVASKTAIEKISQFKKEKQ